MSLLNPKMPVELYREVISTLDVDNADARHALLSLALASKQLRKESQRVLFSSNASIVHMARDDRDAVVRYHQFVQTIFNYPARWAPYVRTFIQVDVESGSNVHQSFKFKGEMKMRKRLQELTFKTLPYMINLKSLIISMKYIPGPAIIQSCDFQLEVLRYRPLNNNDNLLSVVLPSQRGLLHLTLDSNYTFSLSQTLALLADNTCVASLISVECDILVFASLARTRKITAFTMNTYPSLPHDDDTRLCKDALLRLRYLKFDGAFSNKTIHDHLILILGGTHLKIELLEMNNCSYSLFTYLLAPLPELRLLSLRFPGSTLPKRSARITGTQRLFRTYAKLERVFFWDEKNVVKWVYSKPDRMEEEEDQYQGVGGYWDTTLTHANRWRLEVEIEQDGDDERDALHWEKKLPAEEMWGTMWWRQCWI